MPLRMRSPFAVVAVKSRLRCGDVVRSLKFAVKLAEDFAVKVDGEVAVKFDGEIILILPKTRGPDTLSIPVL